MMRKVLMAAGLCLCGSLLHAKVIEVTEFDYSGPFAVRAPLMIDSTDVNAKPFDGATLLDYAVNYGAAPATRVKLDGGQAPAADGTAVHMLSFALENKRYLNAGIDVKGPKKAALFVDGKKSDGKVALHPSTHRVTIKYLTEGDSPDSLRVTVTTDGDDDAISLRTDGKRMFTLADVLHGTKISGTSMSPDGKYLIVNDVTTRKGGKSESRTHITEIATGRTVANTPAHVRWMPRTSRYYYTRAGIDGRELVTVDPATGSETVMASGIPEGSFTMAPTEDYLLYTLRREGPKEDPAVYQVLEPEDRQPGWRTRAYPAKYDLSTGLLQPLTFGHRNARALDISDDGTKVLLMTSESRLERRPTTLFSLTVLDLPTMTVDTVVADDGFISGAILSPDGKRVIVSASPEAFSGIGSRVPEGRIPSMVDGQLFMVDLPGGEVTPLTADFDPAVTSMQWSRADGMVYFTAENRDLYSLYRLDPSTGHIAQIPVAEDLVKGFTLARTAPVMAWWGQGASSPDALYLQNTKTLRMSVLDQPSVERLADVKLGECQPWSFVNSRGDSIHGRFYLPPDFDPAKKYPLIVNYYGGCSPTSRNFDSRYPHHAYAALGYVLYVIEPSGATGFGQEFSSRHVNTAGQGVADDIIEGTRRFCEEHPYVNPEKIGCIGASYGGFMTMYLQTVTDLFAAAISHAGISDHTSYWGEGYWGYSYSEVSMAGSYPWSDAELYVKQSPLYNADKIHTPILFLHGDKDNNVPVGESIQMFTALKLLGRETAFVAVADQDHHILDYDKRIKWQDTIWAWFAKHLQDDPTWWDALYPPKTL